MTSPNGDQAYDVEFRGITKRFGSLTAVDDVTLRVRKGEFLSLLGPSGCGKTTSLRLIAGFEQPDAGNAPRIGGVDAVGIPPYKRDVNTVFQKLRAVPAHVGAGQRRLRPQTAQGGQGLSALPGGRPASTLELVQLTGREQDHPPTMLSGGQQQRVALARALVNRPRVLLDEPLGALDLKLRNEMQIELKPSRTSGHHVLYVTHDQEEALSMSDRVAVMSNGVIEQLDEPRAIYDRPVSPFVADFIGDMNFLGGEVTEVADGAFAVDAGAGVVVVCGLGMAERGSKVLRVGVATPRAHGRRGPAKPAEPVNADAITKMYLGDQIQIVATLITGYENSS